MQHPVRLIDGQTEIVEWCVMHREWRFFQGRRRLKLFGMFGQFPDGEVSDDE